MSRASVLTNTFPTPGHLAVDRWRLISKQRSGDLCRKNIMDFKLSKEEDGSNSEITREAESVYDLMFELDRAVLHCHQKREIYKIEQIER